MYIFKNTCVSTETCNEDTTAWCSKLQLKFCSCHDYTNVGLRIRYVYLSISRCYSLRVFCEGKLRFLKTEKLSEMCKASCFPENKWLCFYLSIDDVFQRTAMRVNSCLLYIFAGN